MATVTELRREIDSLDAELIEGIRRRISVSREIQMLRVAEGGTRLVSEREAIVLSRWQANLGEPGAQIATWLLELCRGATPRVMTIDQAHNRTSPTHRT